MEAIKVNDILYKVAFSNEINEDYIEDFISVYRSVFGQQAMSRPLFDRKFIDNIYGNSILVVVYSKDKPVAVRAFWRNDLNKKQAYQPVDTVVLKEYRGKGIFKEMTNIAVSKTNKEDLIYNFPNENSYNQYLKLGWKNYDSYYKFIMISLKNYKKEHPEIIDDHYLHWWFKPKSHYYLVFHKGDDVFLIRQKDFLIKKLRFKSYLIIGRINPEQAYSFKKLTIKAPLLFYYGSHKRFYSRNRIPLNIVCKSLIPINQLQIPVYKMDAI